MRQKQTHLFRRSCSATALRLGVKSLARDGLPIARQRKYPLEIRERFQKRLNRRVAVFAGADSDDVFDG